MDVAKHIAQACNLTVLSCIDFRLQTQGSLLRYLRNWHRLNEQRFDLITVPGACHRLVREPAGARRQLLDDISVSVDLHQPERLVVIQHENCGRYHSQMRFPNWEREKEILEVDLVQAVPHLHSRFPGLEIYGYIARLSPAGFVNGLDRVLFEPAKERAFATPPAASM